MVMYNRAIAKSWKLVPNYSLKSLEELLKTKTNSMSCNVLEYFHPLFLTKRKKPLINQGNHTVFLCQINIST